MAFLKRITGAAGLGVALGYLSGVVTGHLGRRRKEAARGRRVKGD